jgi:predicted nucleic acid-binding protein
VYLLDTNVISELRKRKPHGGVIAWLNSVGEDTIFLSAVTLGELQAGIELTRRQDGAKAEEIEAWVDQLAQSYQILPMDDHAFRECARLMHSRPNQLLEDAMLAATAIVHRLVVATRNTRDFGHFRVPLFNPFTAK